MERDEGLVYDRGYGRSDILYMAGGTIAAIGYALGHMWARYLGKDFWEVHINDPKAVEMRTEWLREAYKLIKEDDLKGFREFLKEGSEVLPELSDEGPFYLANRPAEAIYDLVAVIGHTTASQSTYLDLVMHTDPVVRRLAWEGGKEPPPPPFSDEAKRALEKGALGFLVDNTYDPYYFDYPGIRHPDVSVKYTRKYEEYGEWGTLKNPPISHADAVERNVARLHYEHTTETGRGEFSVSYGDGVYDFHFRVVRGGEYKGLTAIETHVRIVDKGSHPELSDALLHQITPLAEERHYLFATNVLRVIGKSIETEYAVGAPSQISPAAEKIKTLAEILKEEYEVKFGRYPERGEYEL
jgi:hypothetical protein